MNALDIAQLIYVVMSKRISIKQFAQKTDEINDSKREDVCGYAMKKALRHSVEKEK